MIGKPFYAVGFSPEEKKAARYLNGQGDHDENRRSHSDREVDRHDDDECLMPYSDAE